MLKGGVLLAAFAVRRPTRDIDLQATGLANDAAEVAARLRAIAALDLRDGVVFDLESLTAAVIRDDDEYAGVRVRLVGALGRARLTIGVDVNFGDPIWPEPHLIRIPRVLNLGQPPLTVLGYPLTMVLAEKIVTAVERGEANTRWRDFADIYTLIRLHHVDGEEFVVSLETVAAHRKIGLLPLLPALSSMGQRAQPKWRAWRVRMRRENDLSGTHGEEENEATASRGHRGIGPSCPRRPATGCSSKRRPSALVTFRSVAQVGLPSAESAL